LKGRECLNFSARKREETTGEKINEIPKRNSKQVEEIIQGVAEKSADNLTPEKGAEN
jgi:hypothetical protein